MVKGSDSKRTWQGKEAERGRTVGNRTEKG